MVRSPTEILKEKLDQLAGMRENLIPASRKSHAHYKPIFKKVGGQTTVIDRSDGNRNSRGLIFDTKEQAIAHAEQRKLDMIGATEADIFKFQKTFNI